MTNRSSNGSLPWTSARPSWCAASGFRRRRPAAAFAGGVDAFDDDPVAGRAGQPPGRPADRAGGDGGHQRLLEAGVLPARGARSGAVAGQCPGRQAPAGRPKTDMLDAVWLCKVAERQMLRPSFVPPRPIRQLRDLTRYRIDLVGARTAEKKRVEKLLEDACIKLSVVASDIFGVSGREMMAALIAGERDPAVLADLARTRMRGKIPQLREAFTGHFDDHHRFLLSPDAGPGRRDRRRHRPSGRPDRGAPGPFRPAGRRGWMRSPGSARSRPRSSSPRSALDMTRFPTPGTCAPGPSSPRASSPQPARTRATAPPATATATWPGSSARPPSRAGRTDTFLGARYRRHRPTPREEEGHGRGRPLHPGHHLAPPRATPTPASTTWAPTTSTATSTPTTRRATTSDTRSARLQGHPRTRRLTAALTQAVPAPPEAVACLLTCIFGLDCPKLFTFPTPKPTSFRAPSTGAGHGAPRSADDPFHRPGRHVLVHPPLSRPRGLSITVLSPSSAPQAPRSGWPLGCHRLMLSAWAQCRTASRPRWPALGGSSPRRRTTNGPLPEWAASLPARSLRAPGNARVGRP